LHGAFANTDFRTDLTDITVPCLVLHGSADAVVPLAGSGERTHRAVRHSELVVFEGAPHGLNVTHAAAFNGALLGFLARPA
jgi:non-heme chloroperoxidase